MRANDYSNHDSINAAILRTGDEMIEAMRKRNKRPRKVCTVREVK